MNYLELEIPLRKDAEWFENLRNAMKSKGIPARWTRKSFHITAVFIFEGNVKGLETAFSRHLEDREAPSLTLDKLDAFTTNDDIIVNITSSRPSESLTTLIKELRAEAENLGVDYRRDFRLHITIGKIDKAKADMTAIATIINSLEVPTFTLRVNTVNYRHKGGKTIKTWHMVQNTETMTNYQKINFDVMTDTKKQYESVPELIEAVKYSIDHQYIVAHEENIDQSKAQDSQTKYICSGKRSFEAAKAYKGKKTAVLNFANNHAAGGAPYSAGAQEESLCRCSTLLPCLQALYGPFYKKHMDEYGRHIVDEMGSDDLIYTPDVVVFKTDERTDPICPQMMDRSEWYKVDVITCAAPDLRNMRHIPANYEEVIFSRVKKILDVAAKERVEALILGAWGCGAFKNDPVVVSMAFHSLLKNYNFEVVEFALASNGDVSGSVFARGLV